MSPCAEGHFSGIDDMNPVCQKCGGEMERGETTALFIVRGIPTSLNPVRAFLQGAAGDPRDRAWSIDGYRCTQCGSLEFSAVEPYKVS